ncbi:hypothetical protein LP420_00780 [Massilia sp. B-10]|nr:hypothetical protein LP420_00780 [Massilia sp. B-10]UUZ54656.1 hypothetical protein LP419_00725 [Massilia sp. H-1]
MRVVVKVLLFGLAAAGVLVVAAIGGMPGARDGELHLAGDYYFTHSGGFQNSITEEQDGVSRFVVHAKVEEFIVQGQGVFVSRRPVHRQKIEGGIWNFQLADTCEYFRIDAKARKVYGPFSLAEVKKRPEWHIQKDALKDLDFGPTMCKLSAV